jgi:hypothetical protein
VDNSTKPPPPPSFSNEAADTNDHSDQTSGNEGFSKAVEPKDTKSNEHNDFQRIQIPLDADFEAFVFAYNSGNNVTATNGLTYSGAYDLNATIGRTTKFKKPRCFVIEGGKERRYVSFTALDAILVKGKCFLINLSS